MWAERMICISTALMISSILAGWVFSEDFAKKTRGRFGDPVRGRELFFIKAALVCMLGMWVAGFIAYGLHGFIFPLTFVLVWGVREIGEWWDRRRSHPR